MICAPRIGQRVQVWYRRELAPHMPLHGRTGEVVRASRGKPRNHLVRIDGREYVVPCGNLRAPKP